VEKEMGRNQPEEWGAWGEREEEGEWKRT